MRHRRKRPDDDGDGVTHFGTDLIDHLPKSQQSNRIGRRETHHDETIIGLRPVQFLLQRGLQQADHLAI